MSRGPLRFKQSDVARAIKAAKDAGLTVRGIDARTGIVLIDNAVDIPKGEGLGSWSDAIAELEQRR